MISYTPRFSNLLRAVAAMLFAAFQLATAQWALASKAPVISGGYDVIQRKELGSQEQIRVHIHLLNRGASSVSVQRITIWGRSRPEKGGTRSCAVTLGAHGAADTTQEFTIRRADYQLWQKGHHPRLILDLSDSVKHRSRAVVRLEHLSSQEVK